jgi:succinylglutamate desuccinylase
MALTHPIRRVLLVGGTHGNELLGVYLIKKFEQHPASIQRSTFETLLLVANPEAIAASRRYIDNDLNRCFRQQDLQNATLSSYEHARSREISSLYGATGKTPADVIVDLHSTTANMGLTLIIDEHPFNLRLAAHLQSIHQSVKVCVSSQAGYRRSSLPALCPLGCTIEVGAVAQGTLHAGLFLQTEALVHTILDYLEQQNQNTPAAIAPELTIYRYGAAIDYPRDDRGNLQAMIHPQLQFRDYELLTPGDPMFLTLMGETIPYAERSPAYPVFINEAAYYEKGIALYLTEKQQIKI